MYDFAVWLGKTSVSVKLGEAVWIIPILQSIHILAVAMVLSSVLMIDLRLFGLTTVYSVRQILDRFMPFLWSGLAILAGTGLIQITAEPKRTLNANPAFYLKMAMLVVAVAVTVGFLSLSGGMPAIWRTGRSAQRCCSSLRSRFCSCGSPSPLQVAGSPMCW